METKVTPISTKGIIISLLLIVLALTSHFMDIKPDSPFQYIGYAVFIGGIIWSILSYGKEINHNATFGKYFAHGFKVSALVTVIMVVFVFIFIMLFPEIKDKAIDEARKNMGSKNLSEEQISAALEMTRKFFTVFLIAGTLFGYILVGCIVSLIGAAVTKKQPNNFAGDINQIGQ